MPPKRSRGRPSLPGSAKLIRLRESVFNLWRARKTAMGFVDSTDSAFAEVLLHCSYNGTRDSGEIVSSAEATRLSSTSVVFVDDDISGLPVVSTPVRAGRPMPRFASPSEQIGTSSAVSDSFVDITGNPEKSRLEVFSQTNNSLSGNPFSGLSPDLTDSVDSDTECQADESVIAISAWDNHQFAELEQSMSVILEELYKSDMSSEEDIDEHSDMDEWNLGENEPDEILDGTQHFNEASMDISLEEDERTLTMIDPLYGDSLVSSQSNEDVRIHVVDDEAGPQPEQPMVEGSKSVEKNKDEILKKLEEAFSQLTDVKGLEMYLDLHSRTRVIVSINKLLELSTDTCALEIGGKVCGEVLHVTQDVTCIGSRVEITRKCKYGHSRKWISSEVLGAKHNSDFYLNDYLLAAAIIISGNNYSKFALLCKALGLSIISSNTFTRFQKHCAAPVISDVWKKMNGLIVNILKQYEEICLCGDGRNDSPGHCARYCVYTLMEHATKVVVDMAVVDKRETGGNSVTMEKEGLRRLLEKMAAVLPFSEITTDASSSIMKLVREMKDQFPQLLELFHSLDIWHKAKKLSKCLHQAARVKGCESLKEWIDDIVNHFWFCCQTCEGSVDELKEVWFGVLHHVCGDHKWAEGECKHSSEETPSNGKTYLKKSSKALAALRKVVLDKKWLSNLAFYVRFRHTSVLESYNSMLTKYAPKRMAFEYPYFIMRIMLAAIDHNMHLARGQKLSAAGEERGHRKYSKRTQKFHAETVKEEKAYLYFPFLMAKMLKERCLLEGSFSQKTDDNVFNPKQIAPTIGMKAAPLTEELMKGPSRLFKPPLKKNS